MEPQHIQVPPVYIINEQLRLPDVATVAWRVPPLPVRRNPPEHPLAQISILKNLLLLSPLNNHGVQFRSGHVTTLLLAFMDRIIMEYYQEKSDRHSTSGPELESGWFFVMRLVLANVHEHVYRHPIQASFSDVPHFHAYKSEIEIKVVDSFVRQVLETMCKSQGQHPLMSTGFSLLTDLVTSTPTSVLSDLTATHLKRCFLDIQWPTASSEIASGCKMPVCLAAYDLLEAILTRSRPFSLDLLKHFVQINLIGSVFQALEWIFERQEIGQLCEEEGSLWIFKCWNLLTALASVCRWRQKSDPSQPVLTELEEQFVQEMIDPYQIHTTSVHHALANLKFMSIYLDSPHCQLYDRIDVFLKLLKWLRDALNRAWHQNETEWVAAVLDVVTVVCGHVTNASISMVQSFLDGLLATLGWLEPLEGPGGSNDGSLTDRTVPLSSITLEDWKTSKTGSSKTRIVHYRNVEISAEEPSSESESHESQNASMQKAKQQDPPIRRFPVDPRLTSEPESPPPKPREVGSRQDAEIQECTSAQSSPSLVIPTLNLGSLNLVREWQQGRRSVASTVYSSEYPARPLSQISDQSGAFTPPDILRQGTPIPDHESGPGANWMPPSDVDILRSELYGQGPSRSVHDDVPSLQLPLNTERMTYFHHSATSYYSRESADVESSIEASSGNSAEKPSLRRITITLEKRARSVSAVEEMASSTQRLQSIFPDATAFHKMHSFDRRHSRVSLAMRHLVGDIVSVGKETNTPSTDQQSTVQTPLPNIVLFSQEHTEEHSHGSEMGDDGSGTAVTVYAGSHSTTDAKEVELEWILNEKRSLGDPSTDIASESMTSLLSRFKLSACDRILNEAAIHAAILKAFLRFLLADYSNEARERPLTRMIAIGLHKHFHFVPRNILLMLKDWAIQHHLPQIYLLFKMMAKSLFDEQHYPSSRRIARGVFSSIHECSCPVMGGPPLCCVKVIDLPKDLYGMRSLKDLFMELAILQRIQSLPQAVRLYDVGTSEDNLYIVMKLYKMDLMTWREGVTGGMKRGARMLFKIFAEILRMVDALHAAGIVHFDLKCSNILLDPVDAASSNLYAWSDGSELPFRLILGDFGEAMFTESVSEGLQRSRGTQAFMSPEMLVSGSAGRRTTPGVPSDAWSLGCLFYELLTGELLFDDSDYSEFHTRLTTTSRALVDPIKVNKIPPEMREAAWICLSYLLVRNPSMRAPLKAVAEWVDHLLATHALPEMGRMLLATPEGHTPPPVHHLSQTREMSPFPRQDDFEIRRDYLPLSVNVCLLRFVLAKDPWSLAEHHITHVIFVRLVSSPKDDLLLIRNSTLRANGLLFEVLISEDEECSILSLTDHCQRCCQNVLLSCAASHCSHIAIVIGNDTGSYAQLLARFLIQEQDSVNLDASLFV